MAAVRDTFIRRLYAYFTLKRRILYLFVLSTLIPVIGGAIISYYAIASIMANKIDSGIVGNLRQIQLSLENTISNLNHVSQQMTMQGTVGKKLDRYLSAEEPFERSMLTDELYTDIGSITFTNPNIGLATYYSTDEGSLFGNFGLEERFDPEALPSLFTYYGLRYYGPHPSYNPLNEHVVLSAMRSAGLSDREDIQIYVESGFRLTKDLLDNDTISRSLAHVLLDNGGRIVYSEQSADFPQGEQLADELGGITRGGGIGEYGGYRWYARSASQGWTVMSVIPLAEFNKERDQWMRQISALSLAVLGLNLLLGLALWRMVYIPLTQFNKEIRRLADGKEEWDAAKRVRIPEFSYLLQQLLDMKRQIGDLFREVQEKEKRRADLEIEKLLYQINPHFLMNTLDTAHWLAVMNGQTEIDRLVVALNKLLYYNLGKQGGQTTVKEELDALHEYLVLQQIRYDFEFDVRIDADDDVLEVSIPRFILQPLVENALYHGLKDDGYIEVKVTRADRCIQIIIRDNGEGMTPEKISRLLQAQTVEHGKVGMGIGMNYVKRMLDAHYEGDAEMAIESREGDGTTVRLSLPDWPAKEGRRA